MTMSWTPLPHIALDVGGGTELALNALLYVMTLSLLGAFLWLAALGWSDRQR
jgi:hypothetical protein